MKLLDEVTMNMGGRLGLVKGRLVEINENKHDPHIELIHAVEYAAARCLHISALGKKRGMKWIIEEAQAARKQLDRAIELLNTAPRALDGKDGGKS